jgi:hypothetical protein
MKRKLKMRGTMAMLSILLIACAPSFEDADRTSFWIRNINRLMMATKVKDAAKVAVATDVTVEVVTVEIIATVPLVKIAPI